VGEHGSAWGTLERQAKGKLFGSGGKGGHHFLSQGRTVIMGSSFQRKVKDTATEGSTKLEKNKLKDGGSQLGSYIWRENDDTTPRPPTRARKKLTPHIKKKGNFPTTRRTTPRTPFPGTSKKNQLGGNNETEKTKTGWEECKSEKEEEGRNGSKHEQRR